ncbi:MAG: hypothetical protein ACE5F1_04020, partial [Planctomycetota bacterium]
IVVRKQDALVYEHPWVVKGAECHALSMTRDANDDSGDLISRTPLGRADRASVLKEQHPEGLSSGWGWNLAAVIHAPSFLSSSSSLRSLLLGVPGRPQRLGVFLLLL